MTIDASALMENYREAIRHLWNAHFRPVLNLKSPSQLLRRFSDTKRLLFRSLVAEPLGIFETEIDAESLWEVEPRSSCGCPILINREIEQSGYWDNPINTTSGSSVKFRFIDFFDWDQLGQADLIYCLVKIEHFSAHPHLVGYTALLEVHYVRFIFAPKSSSKMI